MGKQLKAKMELTYAGSGKEDRPDVIVASNFLENEKVGQSYTVTVKEWQVNLPVQKPDFVLKPDGK